jgi:hypothetical protein
VRKFAETVIKVLGPEYLRAPNAEDTTRLLTMAKAGGWTGMLGKCTRDGKNNMAWAIHQT